MPNVETSIGRAGAPEAEVRAKLVETACEGWKDRLIDLSRRNNLLYYKPVLSGTLELPVTPELTEMIWDRQPVAIRELLASDQDKTAAVRAIARKGLENLEEKGLSTLYLGLGSCTWTADDGGRNPKAPILLVPISLKLKGLDLPATEVLVTGEPEVNPVLLHVFNKELNVSIAADDVLETFSPELEAAPGEETELSPRSGALNDVIDQLNQTAASIPGFRAEPFAVLANFSFQKLAMVKDLESRGTELLQNDVVAAIAGDTGARRKLGSSQIDIDPTTLDRVSPDAEFAVLEADSSQQCAIAGICRGQSAVVHGPPGTGKSQTITNLIANLSAQGKKVLFVAEKRAALEVVMNRLKSIGLDHLAIDLHGAEQTPKKVMERVARTLNTVREAGKPSSETVHQQFVDRRDKLNRHDARMHTAHEPTNQTVFDMQAALLRLPYRIESSLRWRGADLLQITPARAARIVDLLTEAAGFETLFNRTDSSPWTGAQLKDGDAVQSAIDIANELSAGAVPKLSVHLEELTRSSGLRAPVNLVELGELLGLVQKFNSLVSLYSPDVFSKAADLIDGLALGQASGVRGVWIRFTNAAYKDAHRAAISLRKGVTASRSTIFDEITTAKQVSKLWVQWAGSNPMPTQAIDVSRLDERFQGVQSSINEFRSKSTLRMDNVPIEELSGRVSALAVDSVTPFRLRKLYELEQELFTLGVQRLVDEIRTTHTPSPQWPSLFQYAWLSSTLDGASIADPGVRAFLGSTHNSYVADFKHLDKSRLQVAADRVGRAHAEHAIAAMNNFPEQETLIRGEAAKSRRHRPLRKVFAEATEVLTAVCPCWMASPLSVCQLINSTGVFDYVIFDEASQVLPEDAVPAILRGKHVIVAGDNMQLPPTTFFSASEEDVDEESEAAGYESLLDMMIPFVKGFHLNWHYRSRDEALIAFSNHHIYDDRLITFPSPGGTTSISHVYAEYVPDADGQEESSAEEVSTVVRLVLNHARTTPDLSLGVITMGVKHTNRIQAALDREIANNPELADCFDTERPERFFVKNLERVQGDERDVIIISVGYGKDRAANLPLRFGPILAAGGRRRLNVAATRAKTRVIVVSSFRYSDIDSTKVRQGTGLEFLKNYLQYASSGGRLLSDGDFTNEPMNDFEADVFEALSAKGLALVPQVGCSNFRIDLAACHPTQPGRFVLAIECDGATYHSSYTARDRDRLRQQQLENLGWTFHRIWSTDWFLRKYEEVDRALQAFNKAVSASDLPKKNGHVHPANDGNIAVPHATSAKARSSPVAPIRTRSSIGEYSERELQSLLQWVQSDGKLRTNDELADEMFEALPFSRRGSKIEEALNRTIRAWEKAKRSSSAGERVFD